MPVGLNASEAPPGLPLKSGSDTRSAMTDYLVCTVAGVVLVGVITTLWLTFRKDAAPDHWKGGATAPTEPSSPGGAEDDAEKYPGGAVSIYFGSQTGTAQGFAQVMKAEGRRLGFKTQTIDLEDFDPEQIKQAGKAIFLMATYGEGEPTDNASRFLKWLETEEVGQEAGCLAGLQYTVFGLGNKQYEHYNRCGKLVNAFLHKLGAARMYEYGEGDDDHQLEEEFCDWRDLMWQSMQKQFTASGGQVMDTPAGVEEAPFNVRIISKHEASDTPLTPEGAAASSVKFYWQAKEVPMRVSRELRAPEDGGSTMHIEFGLESSGLTYQTADNLAVLPENDPEVVERLAKHMGYDLDAHFVLEYKEATKAIFPTPCSVRQALTCYLDIASIPRKGLLQQLVPLATAVEQEHLKFLVSADGKDDFHSFIDQAGRILTDVLVETFPSIKLTLGQLFHLMPHLQPRYYTISSSSSVYPKDVHVTVAVLQSKHGHGDTARVYRGICSNYLQRLQAPPSKGGKAGGQLSHGASNGAGGYPMCKVFVRASSFRLPTNPSTPIIMVGPGTGVAPMRALLQERRHQKQGGASVGLNILYFGCRNQDLDFLYKGEVEAFQKDKTLDQLHLAFSRMETLKVYVQHRLASQADFTWKLIAEGAYVYVCGGTLMGADIQKEITLIVKQQGGHTEEEAKVYVKKLFTEGRYVQELWSA